MYDIRSKRDVAHLADGIDPNLQDATLVVSVLDWITAEFIRLHHSVSANDAQKLLDELVTRVAPVVEDFDGFLKLCSTRSSARPTSASSCSTSVALRVRSTRS